MPDRIHRNAQASMHAAFTGVRVGADGDRLGVIELGALLGIESTRYANAGADQPYQSVMLRKRSGDHELASVVIYDKTVQAGGTLAASTEQLLVGLLRVDITLKGRGLDLMMADAIRAARSADRDLVLVRNKKKAVVRSEANIARAIAALERHYEVRIGNQTHRGYAAWLVKRVLHQEFFLDEIFNYTPVRWRAVRAWMRGWSAKDDRYAKAFEAWRASASPDQSLAFQLKQAGFSKDVASKRLRELAELGSSGRIPPSFWLERRVQRLFWGASEAELREFMRRTKNKQPVRQLMARWRIRMRPVGKAIRHALTEFASMPPLLTVPVIGSISSTAIVTPQTLLTATKLSISQRALPQTSRPVLV